MDFFTIFLGPRWQQIEFRSSPEAPVGSETSFGVMISEWGTHLALCGAEICRFNNGLNDRCLF